MAQRNRTGDRLTRFVFTINNWTQEEYTYLTEKFAPTVKWIVIGKELSKPEDGSAPTPHLQCACILGTRMAFSALKKLPGFKRAHIEQMRGQPVDSLIYCTKEDSNAFVLGDLPKPGKRNDISGAVLRIQNGESLRSMAKDDEGGIAVVKFHKGLTVLRSLCRPQRTSPPSVFWLYGPTGVGKTRSAYAACARLCKSRGLPEDDIWISSGGLRWFDGYDGQLCVIFDDFRNKHVTSFAFFLRLLDRYPVQVEFKGGFINFTPQFIFITCPYSPQRCFEKRGEHVPEDIQ